MKLLTICGIFGVLVLSLPLLLHFSLLTFLGKFAGFKESILSRIKESNILDIRSGAFPADDFVENLWYFLPSKRGRKVTILIVEDQEALKPPQRRADPFQVVLTAYQQYFDAWFHSLSNFVSSTFPLPKSFVIEHSNAHFESIVAQTKGKLYLDDFESFEKENGGVLLIRDTADNFETKRLINGVAPYESVVLSSPSLCSWINAAQGDLKRPELFEKIKTWINENGHLNIISLDIRSNSSHHNSAEDATVSASVVPLFKNVLGELFATKESWELLESVEFELRRLSKNIIHLLHVFVIKPYLQFALWYKSVFFGLVGFEHDSNQAKADDDCAKMIKSILEQDSWHVETAKSELLVPAIDLYGIHVVASGNGAGLGFKWFF